MNNVIGSLYGRWFLTVCCVIYLLTSGAGCRSGNNAVVDTCEDVEVAPDSIRLIFAGDVMGHSTQFHGAWRDGGDSCYNFVPTFQWVKDYISSADLAIANLEVTFAGEPYTGYPRFSSPVALAVGLRDAGFEILLTANNHTLDNGAKGLEKTIDVIENLGFSHTGSFRDSADWATNNPLMVRKNGFNLAFLNYTYGTNGFVAKSPVIVNYMDTMMVAGDLDLCRAMEADFIIACVHWGEEYQNKENEAQRQFAAFLARNGCNLIVGSHPHVVQPINKITVDSVLVAWSLGNLVSNQRWRYSDGGIMLEVTLKKTDSAVHIESYRYEPFWVHRFPDKNAQIYRIIPINDFLSNPERYQPINTEDEKKLWQFFADTERIIDN